MAGLVCVVSNGDIIIRHTMVLTAPICRMYYTKMNASTFSTLLQQSLRLCANHCIVQQQQLLRPVTAACVCMLANYALISGDSSNTRRLRE